MRREAKVLLSKATDSILLGIEHFNRPWDRGRHEAVLIFIDRGFELLLKAVIVVRGGRIRERRAKETIGFDACVRKCISDAQTKCISGEEALTIQIVNSLRDAAQHYVLDISEQQLYIYIQSGLTLFDKILKEVFSEKLTDYLPDRVLPITSNPPTDFGTLMDIEFTDLKKLSSPRARTKLQAKSKLRSFAIVEASLTGSRLQPSETELGKLVKRISRGENWQTIFPNINRLVVDTEDKGMSVTLKITKSKGQPIHLVSEGTPGATVVAVKRVSELGYYSLNSKSLAEKVGLSLPRVIAIIKELKMQENPEYFKEFTEFGTFHPKRYSPKALDYLKKQIPNLDIERIWVKYRPAGRRKAD